MSVRAYIQYPFQMERRIPDDATEAAEAVSLAKEHGLWCAVFLRIRARGKQGRFSGVSDAIKYKVWLMNQWTGEDGVTRPLAPVFVGYGVTPVDAVKEAIPATTVEYPSGTGAVLARTGEHV